MRKQILATAAALAIAAGATTSATASEHGPARSGSQVGRAQAGGMYSFRHGSRFDGVRGFESAHHGGWEGGNPYGHGGFVDLGPLGITAACGRSSCSPGYSVSAWSR